MQVPQNRVTALIGPSGCGKSDTAPLLHRMNDLIPGAGSKVRSSSKAATCSTRTWTPSRCDANRHVFQKPNPFPKSIYENVAFGARINGYSGDMDRLVEDALRRAALWTKSRTNSTSPDSPSPEDNNNGSASPEPSPSSPRSSSWTSPPPPSTPSPHSKSKTSCANSPRKYTIVVVTHNMQQAGRVSDYTAFLLAGEERVGRLVEFGPTQEIFTNPLDQRTEDYITGRYG